MKRRAGGWWDQLDFGLKAAVVAGGLGAMGAIIGAFILGIFGLIDSDQPVNPAPTVGVVSGESDLPEDEDRSEIPSPQEDAAETEEPQAETPGRARPEPEPAPELTSGNGNSQAKATRLFAGVPMERAVDNGTDVDWYVYRAPEEEEVELSLSMDEPVEEPYGSQAVSILASSGTIEEDRITSSEPLQYAVGLASGEEIYVKIQDDCGSGCGAAPYRLTLNTGPPG